MSKNNLIHAIITAAALSLCFVGLSSAQTLESHPPQGTFGMGATYCNDMVGFNMEASWIKPKANHGAYVGLETGNRGGGADDFFTMYFGRTQRLFMNGQVRAGITAGSMSIGNTVTDLTSWGMGRVVGTDGRDYFILGGDIGVLFKTGEHSAISAMASGSTVGPMYRLTFNLAL